MSGVFSGPEACPHSGASSGGKSVDSRRFDRLVRTFGQTRSRRQALRALAGLAAAGVLLARPARGGCREKARRGVALHQEVASARPASESGDPGSQDLQLPTIREVPASDTFLSADTSETCAPNDAHNCVAGAEGAVECRSGPCCNAGCGPADSVSHPLSVRQAPLRICNNDCTALAHVHRVLLRNGTCVIDSCQDGFFDCDGDASTGCEADSTIAILHRGLPSLRRGEAAC